MIICVRNLFKIVFLKLLKYVFLEFLKLLKFELVY